MRKTKFNVLLLVATIMAIASTKNEAFSVSYVIDQITFDPHHHYSTSINNNTEIVWLVVLNDSGTDRAIVSNIRGTMTQGMTPSHPFINNNGDIAWDQSDGSYRQIFVNGGQATSGNTHHMDPAINTAGEIVWAEKDGLPGHDWQIVSNVRGQITSGEDVSHLDPAINDLGEILWVETEPQPYTIMSNIRGTIAQGQTFRFPSINNNGEVVWSGAVGDVRKIFSLSGGIVELGEGYQDDPSINDFGQISYTQKVGEYYQVFRASPIPEPTTIALVSFAAFLAIIKLRKG